MSVMLSLAELRPAILHKPNQADGANGVEDLSQ